MKRLLSLFIFVSIFVVNVCAQKTVFVKLDAGNAYYRVVTINQTNTKTDYYCKKISDIQSFFNISDASLVSQMQYDSVRETEYAINDKNDAKQVLEEYYGRYNRDYQNYSNMTSRKNELAVGYRGFVEVEYLLGLGDYKKFNRVGLLTSHGYQHNSWFFIGAGAGIEYDYDGETLNAPIFADFRFGTKSSPFFDAKIGYSVSIDKGIDGFFANPSIGVRIPFGTSSGLSIGIGYQLIRSRITLPKYYYGHYSSSYHEKDTYCHSLHFKIGVDF